eukprot:3703080-Pyramimonas_sp.AAC.1
MLLSEDDVRVRGFQVGLKSDPRIRAPPAGAEAEATGGIPREADPQRRAPTELDGDAKGSTSDCGNRASSSISQRGWLDGMMKLAADRCCRD